MEIGNCTLAGLGLRDEAVTATKLRVANAGGIKAAAGEWNEGRRTRRKFGQSAYIGERAFQWGYFMILEFIHLHLPLSQKAQQMCAHINDYNGVDGFEILRHQVFISQEQQ